MTLKARDIMRHGEILTVSPNTTVGDFQKLLVEDDVSAAPVVNSSGDLIGLVSQRDVIQLLHDEFTSSPLPNAKFTEKLRERKIADIMETRLHTVTPETDLATVAKILRRHHIHRVLVVQGKSLVGIISTLDFVRPFEDPQLVAAIVETQRVSKYWTPFRHAHERYNASPPKAH